MYFFQYRICLFILFIISVVLLGTFSYYEHLYQLPDFKTEGKNISSRFTTQKKQDQYPTRVLVVTYLRSGSTLIGDILQQYNNSTYAFEPLRYIEEDIKMGKQIDFLNGTHRYYNRDNSSWVLVEMLYRWFTCDVRRINVMDLTSVMLQGSDAYIQYYMCVNSRKRLLHASVAQRRKYIYKCMKLLKQPCESGKVFIIKTIRLEMASVELLLTWLPGLKVIHLLRDPRGKLSSEFNVEPRMEWPSISSRADSVCRQMHSDIIEADRLYKLFPQSIRILQYELFASDTIRKARKLFMFLNLTFTIEMNKYVRTHTLQKDLHDNCFWCTKKTNARLTSVRWRLHMSHKDVQQVDQNCRTLYKTAGYLEIKDEKVLRNLSVPSQVDSWIKYMSL